MRSRRASLGLPCRRGRPGSPTANRDLLWSDVEDIYAAILRHPFVTGLTDGTLPREAFRHYIVQDAHYLRGYARALALCGARAQEPRDTVMFAAHAGGAIAAEQGLHAALLGDLGLTAEAAAAEPVAPTTRAYVSYLLATAHGGSFAEAVAAVLPCYWIYARVGEELLGARLARPALRPLDRDVRQRGVPGRRRRGAGADRPDRRGRIAPRAAP